MVNFQILDSFLNNRKNYGIVEGNDFPNDYDIAVGGARKLKAAMLVFDVAQSSKINDEEFIKYISPLLHSSFHIVSNYEGTVDKYTGDGAMISFCGRGMSNEDVVIRAITTALEISDLVYNLNKKYNFPGINVRLGLDFGPIIVERIGVRGKSELIIVGASAISAKKLESIGKSLDFIQNTTISLGCDFYHNLSSQYKDVCKQMSIPSDFRDYYMNYNSFYNYPRPYPIYNFYGRITNKL